MFVSMVSITLFYAGNNNLQNRESPHRFGGKSTTVIIPLTFATETSEEWEEEICTLRKKMNGYIAQSQKC